MQRDDAEDEAEGEHEHDDRVDFQAGGFVGVESWMRRGAVRLAYVVFALGDQAMGIRGGTEWNGMMLAAIGNGRKE